jgi:hypothetical protein
MAAGWELKPGQVLRHGEDTGAIVLVVGVHLAERGAEGYWLDLVRLGTGEKIHRRARHYVPDPRDDGFLGHALAQVRRAWGWIVEVDVLADADGFEVVCPDLRGDDRELVGELRFGGNTESEALLAARKAAP